MSHPLALFALTSSMDVRAIVGYCLKRWMPVRTLFDACTGSLDIYASFFCAQEPIQVDNESDTEFESDTEDDTEPMTWSDDE